ncbi:MAG: hypothetical protein ACK56W_16810 [Pirellula sp.]|nr:hypothetical protein [Pirellula sp.]
MHPRIDYANFTRDTRPVEEVAKEVGISTGAVYLAKKRVLAKHLASNGYHTYNMPATGVLPPPPSGLVKPVPAISLDRFVVVVGAGGVGVGNPR